VRLTPYRRRTARRCSPRRGRKGWEGLIAKRADSVYSDRRSRDWLEDEVRAGPGARDRRLHRAAGVAYGARRATARLLRRRPAALRGQGRHRLRPGDAARPRRAPARRCAATTRRSPDASIRERGVTWVEPELVAQGRFTGVDAVRAPAPPALPRAARRQAARDVLCARRPRGDGPPGGRAPVEP
jgi:bifunctional non-homologous end joining protein LigD